MNIEEIKNEYERVSKCGDDIGEILKFKKLILSDRSLEVQNLHYELLRRHENRKLYQHLRASFTKLPNIEKFLLEKLKCENNEELQADILHILGRIRSAQSAGIAHDFIKHKNEYHREVASYVLGWTGNKDDIQLLNEHMLNEKKPLLRITAASAHRQIASRMPEITMEILQSLKQGFEREQSDEVISWIIVMLGTIAIRNLGLREDKDDPYLLHGDLEKAKAKTRKFLETI